MAVVFLMKDVADPVIELFLVAAFFPLKFPPRSLNVHTALNRPIQ